MFDSGTTWRRWLARRNGVVPNIVYAQQREKWHSALKSVSYMHDTCINH